MWPFVSIINDSKKYKASLRFQNGAKVLYRNINNTKLYKKNKLMYHVRTDIQINTKSVVELKLRQ